MVDLYILDSFGGKHWVYNFSSEKEAVEFINLNNTEKMEYVVEEIKDEMEK